MSHNVLFLFFYGKSKQLIFKLCLQKLINRIFFILRKIPPFLTKSIEHFQVLLFPENLSGCINTVGKHQQKCWGMCHYYKFTLFSRFFIICSNWCKERIRSFLRQRFEFEKFFVFVNDCVKSS